VVGDELMAQLRDCDDKDEVEEELEPACAPIVVRVGRRQESRWYEPTLALRRSVTDSDIHRVSVR